MKYADSSVISMRDSLPRETVSRQLSKFIELGGMRQALVLTDRTSAQLKNSGALRLVENEEVSSLILKYWQKITETNGSLERYMIYRNDSRALLFKLWVMPSVYVAGTDNDPVLVKEMKVIDPDPNKWRELTNLMVMCKSITSNALMKDLEEQLEIARTLIRLIRKKYHLK
jgi:hypothetical protein